MSTFLNRLPICTACCVVIFVHLEVAFGQEVVTQTSAPVVVDPGIPVQAILAPPVIDTAKEDKVKSVYLYSFGRFTRWPSSSKARPQFTIAVVGSSGLRKNLERIARKRKIQDKQIRVLEYRTAAEVDPKECDIVFITRNVLHSEARQLLERLGSTSVLTVTDAATPLRGSAVNFLLEAGAVQFEINIEETQRKKLSMDARLLRQGRRMKPSS